MKRWETRAWRTSYAGPLAIHASKGFPDDARLLAHEEEMLGHLPSPTALPRQAVLAVVRVVRCVPTEQARGAVPAVERRLGNYQDGRWAWELTDRRTLYRPVTWRGAMGLWTVPAELEAELTRILGGPA